LTYLDIDWKSVKVHLANEGDFAGHAVQDLPLPVYPDTCHKNRKINKKRCNKRTKKILTD
jgi:hypothetical protein